MACNHDIKVRGLSRNIMSKNTTPKPRRRTTSKKTGKFKTFLSTINVKYGGKMLFFLALKLMVVVVALLVIFGVYLDGKIQERFEGQLWELPAVVYGRILHLAPGNELTIDELKQELASLNYLKVNKPLNPGEYSASKNSIELIRRSFEFEDGQEPELHVMVSFDKQGVSSIEQINTKKQLGYLRIEPKLLGMLDSENDQQRMFLSRDGFPSFLIEALLTTEDRDFYEHDGISVLAILRALAANIRAGRTVQGGSTLNQQIAKNIFLTRERSLWRKIQEAYIAILLDYRYSKDKLLEVYLNEIYLGQAQGQAIHGFPLGARFYFGRPIEELRSDQFALLVGLAKGPSYYNPWLYPERAKKRRNLVLKMMVENGFLAANQYMQASSQPLDVQKTPKLANHQPAYFGQLTHEIKQRVGSQYNPEIGLRIFTTLDPYSQSLIEKSVVKKVKELKKTAGDGLEAAVVIVDRQSGEIRAMVGGSRPNFPGFNRAINGRRQIGSLSKPAIFLAALSEPEQYNLATPIEDKPIVLKGDHGSVWRPRNYDRKYRDQVPLLRALANSYNIPTINIGLSLGLEKVIDMFARLGVDPEQINRVPSLLLGTFTLSPMEVTQMYQTVGSGGRYAELTALRSVVTQNGEVLYRNWPKSSQTVSQQASWLVMYALKDAVKNGTARYLNSLFPNELLAGKTGTTDKNRDSWYVGIDGKEIVTVWLGHDDNKSTKLTGSGGALRVYADYMLQRKPERLILDWPAEVIDVPYRVYRGEFLTDCTSKRKLPMWDPSGSWEKRCKKPKASSWVTDLF